MALSGNDNESGGKGYGTFGSDQSNVPHRPRSYDDTAGVNTDGDHAIIPPRSRYKWPNRKSGSYLVLSPEMYLPHQEGADHLEARSKMTDASRSDSEYSDEDALEVLDSIAELDDKRAGHPFHTQSLQQIGPPSSGPTTALRSRSRSRSPSSAGTERPRGIEDEPFLLDSSPGAVAEPQVVVGTPHVIEDVPVEHVLGVRFDDTRHDSPQRPQSPISTSTPAQRDIDQSLQLEAQPLVQPLGALPEPLGQDQRDVAIEDFSRLMRRVRKRTNEVLIKRTQWRLEYESVQNLRYYLQESTSQLRSALEVREASETLPNNAKAKPRRKRKKRKKLEPAGSTTLPNEEAVSSSPRGDSDAGTTGTGQDLSSSVGSESTANSSGDMTRLFDRYFDDFRALEDQETKEKKCVEELNDLEFRLEDILKTAQANMHSPSFAHDLRAEILTGSYLSSKSSSQAGSEEPLHPLLEEYFRLQGSIGVFIERLGELDYEHTEGLQERDFLLDQLEEVRISDEQFDSNYKDTRLRIERDLEAARKEFAIIEAKCKIAGLDPELFRNADRPEAEGLSSSNIVGSGSRGPSSTTIDQWLLNVSNESEPGEDRISLGEPSQMHMMAELKNALDAVA